MVVQSKKIILDYLKVVIFKGYQGSKRDTGQYQVKGER